jgi:lipopolysaccharide biosynthesis protein
MHHAVERFLGVATQAAGYSVRETGALFKAFPELYNPPSVQAAAHVWVRKPLEIRGKPVCLFVTYSANGEHWPHVLQLCRSIQSDGFVTVMIVATDKPTLDVADPGPEICDGLLIKQNGGFDFAAWALALRLLPELWTSQLLLFVNDSIYGPLCGFSQTCSKIRTSSSDYIALTKSIELKPHYQSYFFALKGKALTAPSIEGFWSSVRMLDYKKEIIERYEIQLLEHARNAGLRTQALFDLSTPKKENPTHYRWRELICEHDFPFIKVELLRDNPTHQNLSGWESLLRKKSYDPELILYHLRAIRPQAPAILALRNTLPIIYSDSL